MSLDFDELPSGVKGRFDRKTNTITLSNDLVGATEETLLHEIQHVLQKVEGFSGGSSIDYWNRKMEDGYSKKWDSGEEMMPSELYRNTAGEIEARDTANRRKLTAEERRAKAPDTGNENTVFAEDNGYMSEKEAERDEEILRLKDQIRANLEEINKMDPVADVKTPETFSGNVSDRRSWVLGALKTTEVHRDGLGKVNIGSNQIRRGLMYAKEQGDIAAFAALPGVIKRGKEITKHENHKGNGIKTITFAGSVIINGKRGVMGAVIHQTNGNNYKAHKLLMPDGSVFVLNEKEEAKSGPVMAQPEKSRLDKRTDSASIVNIRSSDTKSNTQNAENAKKSLQGSKNAAEEAERLRAQNERLTQELDALSRELRRVDDRLRTEIVNSTDRVETGRAAAELLKRFGSKADRTEAVFTMEEELSTAAAGKNTVSAIQESSSNESIHQPTAKSNPQNAETKKLPWELSNCLVFCFFCDAPCGAAYQPQGRMIPSAPLALHSVVERGIHIVHIFLIQLFAGEPQPLAEALEVDDLPLPQETDHVVDIGIVGEPQDVVIGDTRLLLCCNHIRTTFD